MARKSRKPKKRDAGNRGIGQHAVAQLAAAGKANPYEPMARLMQAYMPLAWIRPWIGVAEGPTAPKLDVIDREGSVLVRAEVPGIQKGNLAIEASDVAVTIKGAVTQEELRDGDRYRVAETSFGAFERTVQMPADVDSARAKATFRDGVVEVMLPKVDRSKAHHVKF